MLSGNLCGQEISLFRALVFGVGPDACVVVHWWQIIAAGVIFAALIFAVQIAVKAAFGSAAATDDVPRESRRMLGNRRRAKAGDGEA